MRASAARLRGLVDALLRSCPDFQVLGTSREAMGIVGTRIMAIDAISERGSRRRQLLRRSAMKRGLRVSASIRRVRASLKGVSFRLGASGTPAAFPAQDSGQQASGRPWKRRSVADSEYETVPNTAHFEPPTPCLPGKGGAVFSYSADAFQVGRTSVACRPHAASVVVIECLFEYPLT